MPLTFGSLFAGIGGFDLGFERAGMVCKWQVEIDDYANRVLAKHWPDVRRWPDVRTWPQPDTERVDVICGGFPCQDVSLSNKNGQGLDGKHSGLWREFARIIRELRPRFAVVENVAAAKWRALPTILQDVADLGYDAEWGYLSALAMGAPHRRKRLLVVAYPYGKSGLQTDSQAGTVRGKQNARDVIAGGDWSSLPIARGEVHSSLTVGTTDGVSSRVDRLRCLGNAVVPQVSEWIGRRIVESAVDISG